MFVPSHYFGLRHFYWELFKFEVLRLTLRLILIVNWPTPKLYCKNKKLGGKGVEPLTPWFEAMCSIQLS